MQKLIGIVLSILMVFTMTIPAFASYDSSGHEPIVGTWKISSTYQFDDDKQPVLLNNKEALQCLGYISGIITFNEDSTATIINTDDIEILPSDGQWKKDTENNYTYQDIHNGFPLTFSYRATDDTLHGEAISNQKDSFIYHDVDCLYTRAFTGVWKQDKVYGVKRSDDESNKEELVELSTEEYQELFEQPETILYLKSDGTGATIQNEEDEWLAESGKWEATNDDDIQFSVDDELYHIGYSAQDDMIYRNVSISNNTEQFNRLKITYKRTELPEVDNLEVLQESPLETQDVMNNVAQQIKEERARMMTEDEQLMEELAEQGESEVIEVVEDEIISEISPDNYEDVIADTILEDGNVDDTEQTIVNTEERETTSAPSTNNENQDYNVFTGESVTVYNTDTRKPVELKELKQGGWIDSGTGKIYYPSRTNNNNFVCTDRSILVKDLSLWRK